ncbi:peptidylprolyl isomerase [Lysinibacillus sphaericus]|uniref:peptidylprolyl isomerase n=1 Tax=Lysinibacillus sphaericus TaxID=1421 RepID=UPI001C5F0F48
MDNSTMKRKFLMLALVALTILSTGCSDSKSGGNYVAKVDGIKISQKELDQELRIQYGAEVLETLISHKIIELEAAKQNITVPDEVIQSEYEELIQSYGDEDTFKEVLKSNGLTEAAVKDNIRTYQLGKKVISASIEITDEEVEQYFIDNKDSYGQEEQVEVRHILLEDEVTAQEVLKKVQAGEDFATLAKDYSIDTVTSEDGGNLGYISKGQMDEAFEEAAFVLEVNGVSDIVQSAEGYHVIKVTAKVPAEEAIFENVKDEVFATVLESRIDEEYSIWIAEKLEQYDIENKLLM